MKDSLSLGLHRSCGKVECARGGETPRVLLGEKEITVYNIVTLKGPIIQIIAFSVGNL